MMIKFQELLGINPIKFRWFWIVVNAVGFPLTILSVLILALLGLTMGGLPIVGLTIGLVLGGLQALALRQQIPRLKAWHWITATGLGNGVGLVLWQWSNFWHAYTGDNPIFNIFAFIPSTWVWGLLFLTSGLSVGLSVSMAQLFVLRKHTHDWLHWFWINVLGQSLGSVGIYGLWHVIGIRLSIGDISWNLLQVLMASAIRGIFWGVIGGVLYGMVTAHAFQKLRYQIYID